MIQEIFGPEETSFLIKIGVALLCGLLIGVEREMRHKPAGISTHMLVVAGAMVFAYMSGLIGSGDPGRIAAQIVSGIGFLGAGIILKSEEKGKIANLTTAASIWFAAAVGMAVGFGFYVIALIAALSAVIINRFPHVRKYLDE